MNNQYILSIDPGKSSGLALGVIGDGEPYQLVKAWQVEDGVVGLVDWFDRTAPKFFTGTDAPWASMIDGRWMMAESEMVVCCEKFTPLQNKGFAQTLDSTEPLRCEGALIALGVMPDYPSQEWRRPDRQYIYGGSDLAAKKKRGKEFLKSRGMYLTGKNVGCGDANDALSAIWHGISYAAQVLDHKPTFDDIAEWAEAYDAATGKLG